MSEIEQLKETVRNLSNEIEALKRNGQKKQEPLPLEANESKITLKAVVSGRSYNRMAEIQEKRRQRTGRKAHMQDIAGELIHLALAAVEMAN